MIQESLQRTPTSMGLMLERWGLVECRFRLRGFKIIIRGGLIFHVVVGVENDSIRIRKIWKVVL